MINHSSRNLWIAVGVIHLEETRTGGNLHLQVATEDFNKMEPAAGRILKAGMHRIGGTTWTHQPHYPADQAEVRFKILILREVEVFDYFERKCVRLQDISLRLQIDIYRHIVGSATRCGAHQAIQTKAVGRRLL